MVQTHPSKSQTPRPPAAVVLGANREARPRVTIARWEDYGVADYLVQAQPATLRGHLRRNAL